MTTRRSPMSIMLSREAFRRADRSFARILDDPNDVAAMGDMLLAAGLAGLAIENSMLGAAHSMANPLTAGFNIAHGQAVGMVLPHIVRFNAHEDSAHAEYLALIGTSTAAANGQATTGGVDPLVKRLDEFLDLSGMPRRLSACDVPASAAPQLAEAAASQWTAQFNPRPITAPDFERLYAESI